MFKQIKPEQLKDNPFELIGNEWMLISALNGEGKCNMMTASWGGLGVLWNKPAATIYIRPTRYTDGLLSKESHFSLSFLGKNKKPHKVCGSKSGRDINKLAATGLTAVYADNSVYFEEAELVLVCKKIYTSIIDSSNILDSQADKFYPIKDYHNIYVGEIEKVYIKPDRLGR